MDSIHLLLGTLLIDLLFKYRHLSFLISLIHLPLSSPAVKIFKSRHQISQNIFLLFCLIWLFWHFLMLMSCLPVPFLNLPGKLMLKSLYVACSTMISEVLLSPPQDFVQLLPQSTKDYLKPLHFYKKFPQYSLLLHNRLCLLIHCSDLNGHTHHFHGSGHTPVCQLCFSSFESSYHFLIECVCYNYIREIWFSRVNPDNLAGTHPLLSSDRCRLG